MGVIQWEGFLFENRVMSESIYKEVFLKMRVIQWEHFILETGGHLVREHFEIGGHSVRAIYEKKGAFGERRFEKGDLAIHSRHLYKK